MSNAAQRLIPFWAQGLIAIVIIGLVLIISSQTAFYSSDWSEVNSNFYRNGTDALLHSRINIYQGPVPTLVIFWETDCPECVESLRYLDQLREPINIVGIHLSLSDQDKIAAQAWWHKNAPRKSSLYFDQQNMLEKTFQIRGLPASFVIFPLKNKMLYHVGSLRWSRPNINKVITGTAP